MKTKRFFGKIHLLIGLICSILFFITAFSGAIYTWAPEISRIIYKEGVEPQNAPFVSVSTLKATLDREFPEGDFRNAIFRGKSTAVLALLFGEGTYYYAMMNPYTGALIHVQDMNKGWLNYLKGIHRNLLLDELGQKIVHWETLLFFVMLITGLVLWWPVNKAGRMQRLQIKWGASPKKLNYDLHNVLGFYATWVLIFVVVTGLFWGFEIVRTALKTITGEKELVYDTPKSKEVELFPENRSMVLVDSLARDFISRFPRHFIDVSVPHEAADPISVVVIDPHLKGYKSEFRHFDRYTGKPLSGHFEYGLYKDAGTYRLLHDMVYDIHFGTILGLPGRLLVFFASLIGASLPITGLLVWWARQRKGRPLSF